MLFYSLVARAAEEGETLQPWIVGCVAAVTVMAFASVVLRLTARWTRGQSLAIDDYLIVASMVSRDGGEKEEGSSCKGEILYTEAWPLGIYAYCTG